MHKDWSLSSLWLLSNWTATVLRIFQMMDCMIRLSPTTDSECLKKSSVFVPSTQIGHCLHISVDLVSIFKSGGNPREYRVFVRKLTHLILQDQVSGQFFSHHDQTTLHDQKSRNIKESLGIATQCWLKPRMRPSQMQPRMMRCPEMISLLLPKCLLIAT